LDQSDGGDGNEYGKGIKKSMFKAYPKQEEDVNVSFIGGGRTREFVLH